MVALNDCSICAALASLRSGHSRGQVFPRSTPQGVQDSRIELQQREHLRHPRPADATPPRDLGPVVHHALVEKLLKHFGEVEGVEDTKALGLTYLIGTQTLLSLEHVDDEARAAFGSLQPEGGEANSLESIDT